MVQELDMEISSNKENAIIKQDVDGLTVILQKIKNINVGKCECNYL